MRRHAKIAGRLDTLLVTALMSLFVTCAMSLAMWQGNAQKQTFSGSGEEAALLLEGVEVAMVVLEEVAVVVMVVLEEAVEVVMVVLGVAVVVAVDFQWVVVVVIVI